MGKVSRVLIGYEQNVTRDKSGMLLYGYPLNLD